MPDRKTRIPLTTSAFTAHRIDDDGRVDPEISGQSPPKLKHTSADTLTDAQGDGFCLIRFQRDHDHPGASAPLNIVSVVAVVVHSVI